MIKRQIRKISILTTIMISITFGLVGCDTQKADYSGTKAETALNSNKNIDGKTVKFKVNKVEPNSEFGYNLETGKHMNFASSDNPNVKKGDTVTVKIKQAKSFVGSWIISYTNLQKD